MAYTNTVPGWFNEAEFAILEILAKSVPFNGNIIEIGSHFGRTTVAWADTLTPTVSIWAIDPWSYMEPDERFMKQDNIDNLPMSYKNSMASRFVVFEYFTNKYSNITPIHAYSPISFQKYPPLMKILPDKVDLIFIDAVHKNPEFSADLEFWYPKLTNEGTMCGHDFANYCPDIVNTVREFAKKHNLYLCEPNNGNTVWWMRNRDYV